MQLMIMRSRINDNKIQQRDTFSRLLRCVLPLLLLTLVAGRAWGQGITSLDDITDPNGTYTLASDFSTTGTALENGDGDPIGTSTNPFKGTIDGGLVAITGIWNKPLFDYVEDAVIKNVIIGNASIGITTTDTNVGAIASNAKGESRIYNCGILDGSISGTKYVGGLVGQLFDKASNKGSRVINCFSYADVSGGTEVGGIVGYNNYASKASDIRTMVMNCMFYGDIVGSSKVSPVYGGQNINNNQGGLNTYNFYSYENATTFKGYPENTNNVKNKNYNCALAVEEKFLTRFEFYRQLLNSNKKLAAFYITGNASDENLLAKWVLEIADRNIANPKPYPILKAQGTYPSIINIDAVHAEQLAFDKNGKISEQDRNKGGKIGTLNVTISESNTTSGGQTKPTGATVTTPSLTLARTDKDFNRFNFNYDKVQLPYYDEVGTGNYTGNRVVTGWKITDITAIDDDPYTADNYPTSGINDYPNHNYADRKSSQKDLYSVSGRVFSQGAYFDVPYGVTAITIEPYWGKACYIADANYDVVYKNDYSGKQNVTQTGTQVGNSATFNGEENQLIKTSVSDALTYISGTLGGYGTTVYDNVVVLVGNLHLDGVPSNGTNPFTMMSVDSDNDHEPDYSLIYHHKGRLNVSPIRFDFLNVAGTSQAQRPNSATLACNVGIFKTRGWFEITNTALLYFSQFEYENLGNSDGSNNGNKADGPLILLGGVFDQFVSTQSSDVNGKVIYIHVGGNVWFKEFGLGTHGDGSKSTPHVPVSVTGGDYDGFYLTGTYNQDADVREDNAECYISGGHFVEAAGASQEQIKGNVRWQIYNADIDCFFGGGINAANPITGNIDVDITNSHVGIFCGGPKFGDMGRKNVKIPSTTINFTPDNDRTVVTNATNCTFGTFFGAGYGGTSYSRKKYYDAQAYDFNNWQKKYTDDRGKYFDGKTTNAINAQYGKKGVGVATDFDYEFFIWSKGNTDGRFFVKFASFSLAQCNDVESNLKGCTIENNFYGGGNLGKVIGTASSTLDDCIVKGNAFGAGYSASLPTLEVRDGGFASSNLLPKYNSSSGMFEPGTLSGTTTFEWKNAAEASVTLTNNQSGSNLTDHYIYTDIDLSKSNLGSVGTVSLTLKGDTTIGIEGQSDTGNVYGGGDESTVSGNVTVTLQDGTTINGNVFGGGNRGNVSGSTNVIVE